MYAATTVTAKDGASFHPAYKAHGQPVQWWPHLVYSNENDAYAKACQIVELANEAAEEMLSRHPRTQA